MGMPLFFSNLAGTCAGSKDNNKKKKKTPRQVLISAAVVGRREKCSLMIHGTSFFLYDLPRLLFIFVLLSAHDGRTLNRPREKETFPDVLLRILSFFHPSVPPHVKTLRIR